MAATIRDVAEAAGVSITTVSHVLNGQGRVAETTRRRVAQVAVDLGYRPNVHAQQLVTRKSRTVAIQVAAFTAPTGGSALIPKSDYFLEVLNGASEAAAARGYALILTPPNVDAQSMNEFAVDGAIIVDPRGDEPLFTGEWGRRPVVTTGRPLASRRPVSVVDNDHRAAARAVLDHLAANGYTRPALLTTDTSRSYTRDLHDAYVAWCAAHGVPPRVVEVDEPPSEDEAARALGTLLDGPDPRDAVFASCEDLALGVLHEAQRRGVRVPAELGVCSAVDSGSLQLTSPQVTGVYLHPRELGRRAADVVVDLIEGGDGPVADGEVPVRLVARASTARRGQIPKGAASSDATRSGGPSEVTRATCCRPVQ
ncbi:MAG TPA: LacI family DNA-binding transcriptional regulator [Mycobacteriales bacterium]|nr:LacI family DNA-binding transcriptional regulator [Mycobacteriales bacterium]